MKKMNLSKLGLSLAVLTGLAACGGGGLGLTDTAATASSIVGTWGNSSETDTYNADKTFVLSQGGCTYTGGTYSVSGNKVSVATLPTAATPSGTTPAASCAASAVAGLAGYNFTYTIAGNSLTYVDSNNATTTVFSLTGKWSVTSGTTTDTFTFNADKTYVFAATESGVGSCNFTGGTYTVVGETFTFVTSPTTGTPSASTVSCNIPALAGSSNVVSITSATSLTATDNTGSTPFTRI